MFWLEPTGDQMKTWSDGVVKLWSVGSMRIRASLQYSSTPTRRRELTLIWLGLSVISFVLVVTAAAVEAQQKTKIPRIGILEPGSLGTCNKGLRLGLAELGYVERQNILLEHRHAGSKPDRLRELAGELAQLKPDVIWTHSPPSVLAAKAATSTIPILVGVARDLVELGIVSSLARPGGNVTGMELRDSEIIGKRLELLKQTSPKALRVAVLVNPKDPGHAVIPGNIEQEARALSIELQRVEMGSSEAIDNAFRTIAKGRADALLLPESAVLSAHRQRIFDIAISKHLPTAAGGPHFAEAGSLISYGANVVDVCQRSALFIDKILKGAKPADLPVERPSKFEFIVNLKTAKQIRLNIPPNVLARADKLIK
jgi:putative ABC transport system substrate-binding protein